MYVRHSTYRRKQILQRPDMQPVKSCRGYRRVPVCAAAQSVQSGAVKFSPARRQLEQRQL
jgi:hypothetical protein